MFWALSPAVEARFWMFPLSTFGVKCDVQDNKTKQTHNCIDGLPGLFVQRQGTNPTSKTGKDDVIGQNMQIAFELDMTNSNILLVWLNPSGMR
jgi:hypothetical protein